MTSKYSNFVQNETQKESHYYCIMDSFVPNSLKTRNIFIFCAVSGQRSTRFKPSCSRGRRLRSRTRGHKRVLEKESRMQQRGQENTQRTVQVYLRFQKKRVQRRNKKIRFQNSDGSNSSHQPPAKITLATAFRYQVP